MNKKDVFDFLDALRESCLINMWAATGSILKEFPELTKEEANQLLKEWMQNFGKRILK